MRVLRAGLAAVRRRSLRLEQHLSRVSLRTALHAAPGRKEILLDRRFVGNSSPTIIQFVFTNLFRYVNYNFSATITKCLIYMNYIFKLPRNLQTI